jgi:hypothetical protein
MCKGDGETTDHLLLHCPIAQELWGLVLSMFGVAWVMLSGVEELLACWSGSFARLGNAVIWRMIPHCLMLGPMEGNESLNF